MRVVILLSVWISLVGACLEGVALADNGQDVWLRELKKEAEGVEQPTYHKSVQRLADLIESDAVVRMYVTQMLEQVPAEHRVFENSDSLLKVMNLIIGRAPEFKHGRAFPMSAVLARMMYTPAGTVAFTNAALNGALREILQEWCNFLDSKESRLVLNRKDGWLSPKSWEENKLADFVIPDPADPYGGFASFNDFFHRRIKPELRPVAKPDDGKVIVSANDGTVYKIARGVKKQDRFWIKGQPYSLNDMLAGSQHVDRFVGGEVLQSFLDGSDYHRFHAPIDGTVREARVVDGLMFSELRSEGLDLSGGTLSQGYQASVNTRGLLLIESDDESLGMVCVMPIGITEVSSVTLTVKPGQRLKKGDEVGYFSYGGSSMCLVFQPGALRRFTVEDPNGDEGSPIKVNAQIAEAN